MLEIEYLEPCSIFGSYIKKKEILWEIRKVGKQRNNAQSNTV